MPVVQSALNNSILERIGNRCPLTALNAVNFTGLPQDNPLASITRKVGKKVQVHSIDDIRSTQRQNIQAMLIALEKMRREVSVQADKRRKAAVNSRNRKTGVRATLRKGIMF